jgi:hypothetical protein
LGAGWLNLIKLAFIPCSEHKGVILIACDWQQLAPFTEGLTQSQLSPLQQPNNKPKIT